jgi:hypothetical protein
MPQIKEYLKISSAIKKRHDDSYWTISTKKKKEIEKLIKLLQGRMLGAKSFEFKLW